MREKIEAITRIEDFFAEDKLFDPAAPPRYKRPLRTDTPAVYDFPAKDGVGIRLTRYRGGKKGPVLLAHGLGVSSLIFSIDTIETNLVEYLFAQGYDVWSLDMRASIALPAQELSSTGDDVARQDYPAAIEKILAVTGAKSVQAVAHCWGATTFVMSLLAGLENVRTVVLSQIGAHVRTGAMTRFKSGLHLPGVLEKLGVRSLTAYTSADRDLRARLTDAALRLYPIEKEERCDNPVCRRIEFLYGTLYEHDRLNAATHDAMHEMFGMANIAAFKHLALLVRRGHSVGADGDERYLPHKERLNLPICFIHGGENACFAPESTRLTHEWLAESFGYNQYRRHVIPRYGHIDCVFGERARYDVFPHISDFLDLGN